MNVEQQIDCLINCLTTTALYLALVHMIKCQCLFSSTFLSTGGATSLRGIWFMQLLNIDININPLSDTRMHEGDRRQTAGKPTSATWPGLTVKDNHLCDWSTLWSTASGNTDRCQLYKLYTFFFLPMKREYEESLISPAGLNSPSHSAPTSTCIKITLKTNLQLSNREQTSAQKH